MEDFEETYWSRLRQMIFGGATKHLLAAAPIPVLMAH